MDLIDKKIYKAISGVNSSIDYYELDNSGERKSEIRFYSASYNKEFLSQERKQKRILSKTKEVNYFKITILDVYQGDKYQDTCISDMIIFQDNRDEIESRNNKQK